MKPIFRRLFIFTISVIFSTDLSSIPLTDLLNQFEVLNNSLDHQVLTNKLKTLTKAINQHTKCVFIFSEHWPFCTIKKQVLRSNDFRHVLQSTAMSLHLEIPPNLLDPTLSETICQSCSLTDTSYKRMLWRLPCTHIICYGCFQMLIQSQRSCPTCGAWLSSFFPN